jgi:hypothetical protein
MRNLGIQHSGESLDDSIHFDLESIGPDHGSVDRGIEGRSVASGRQDSYTPHGLAPLESNSKTTYINFQRETPDELPD